MNALSLHDLRKTFDSRIEALKGIDLEVDQGDFFALLGPNGAGKSTAIGIISSLINKSSGRVEVFGHDLDSDPEGVKSCIGLVPQEFNFNQWEPVGEIVVNQAGYYGIPRREAWVRAEQSLKQLELWDRRKSMAMTLSGGMKRRVLIGKALSHEPSVLFLDEPMAGVDVELRKDMWALVQRLRESGVTIILTTHYIEEAEAIADRVGIINDGELLLVDDKQALMHKLGKKQLIIELEEALSAVPDALAPWGLELSAAGCRLTYTYDPRKTQTGIDGLLQAIGEAGLVLKDLNTTQSSLEDIFVNLVRAGS